MSDSANTFTSLQPEIKEKYSSGKKKFSKIIGLLEKKKKCECKDQKICKCK